MTVIELLGPYFRAIPFRYPEPPIPANFPVSVPEGDDSGAWEETLEPGSVLQAEGQSFAIQYRDAAGRLSQRRITVWGIRTDGEGVPCLVARCHERKATRSFRVDRIQIVADLNGEVREPLSDFYRDTFGFRWPVPGLEPSPADEVQGRWSLARQTCRENGVVLLAALALCDGEMVAEEVGEILAYAFRCCSAVGLELSDAEASRLGDYIRRLRPTEGTIDRSLTMLADKGPAVASALLRAGVRVMEADGLVHTTEVAQLQAFEAELLEEARRADEVPS